MRKRKRLAEPAPWVVLAVFLAITLLATKYVWDSSRLADRTRFTTAVQATRDAISFRIETYVNVLRAATGLFAVNHATTRDDFRAYVQHLRIPERYPGIQGVGLSIRVGAGQLDKVVADLRANEFPDFRVWPETPPRGEYHTVVTLEPLDERNRRAIGYDMHTSAPRREAMDRARDTGEPASTSRVVLVQETERARPPGFLIYVPVYNVPSVPTTVAARREQLYGFVYAPFRARDLFGATVSQAARPEVRFVVFDGADLLYDSDAGAAKRPRFTSDARFNVAGRVWTLRFASERTGFGAPFFAAAATALGGLTISVLLFALLYVQLRGRAHAERIAERLRRSEADLQHANRAKDEFLATLSHELRTPMTAILGWSKLLADPLDEETRASAIDAIQKSSRAQAQLIDDLLDVSRITAGKLRIEPRPIELAPTVSAAVDAVTPVAESRGVALRKNLPAESFMIHGDPSRVQQIVWNLLTNAVKFTPNGGSVGVALNRADGQAILTVTDTGQGIDPEFLPHVFERFRQADSSTTRSFTGLGLGLAIVRHLVELHGGSVSADSEGIGRGATFTVRLPLISARAAATQPAPKRPAAAGTTLHGVSVLLVDDEETVRSYASTVFAMSGADVRTASSGAEALELMRQSAPDVVITDIGMPEMDGYSLLREIRGVSTVPVIALTAYARAEEREVIEQAGFDGVITKPVEPAQLRMAVMEVLARAL